MTRALFLDRDGTVNIDYGYVFQIERFTFIPGIFQFCRRAQECGYIIIIITNQSGIARGYYTEEDYHRLTEHMMTCFAHEGVHITDIFHCPSLDGPDRKPAPGLFLKAKAKYDIDMMHSINLGDKMRDLEAGQNAGVGTNLQFTGDYHALLNTFDNIR